MITVLIVEDDAPTRQRLADAVRQRAGLSVLGAVGTHAEGVRELEAQKPRVLLTDLGLPDGSGIDLIRRAGRLPETDSMVITIFGDEKHVVAALEAGATGYLLKDSTAGDIGDAILRLVNGGSPISAKIARYLVRRFQATSPASRDPDARAELTEREREVLERMARGFSYAEVAHALQMSANTVTSHIKNIYRKLSVHSRAEAVFEAAQLGLVRLNQ